MHKIPVIIDTDPGIDDFFALAVAAASDKLDIRAITPVAGNQTYEKVCRNVENIRQLVRMDGVRIATGAKCPLVSAQRTAGNVHGEDGLGGVILPEAQQKAESTYAWDVIYEEAKRAQGRLQIAALGPLTNIAIAVLKYPDLPSMIDKLFVMGGTNGFGNVSPYAEFNIWADPHAADIVFCCGIKTVNMVGLNLTRQAILDIPEYRRVFSAAGDGPLGKIVTQLIDYLGTRAHGLGNTAMTLHDAIVTAAMSDDKLITYFPSYVRVECQSENAFGQTVVFAGNGNRVLEQGEPNVNVADTLDLERFKSTLSASLEKLKGRVAL